MLDYDAPVLRRKFCGVRHRAILLIILSLLSCRLDAQAIKDKLAKVMDGYAGAGFNGTVLVAKKGSILLEKGYGYRNVGSKTPNDANTIYRIAQITEPLTSEAILKMDSKGQLGLDDLVIKYVPGFPWGDRISIRNLLTHTSGLPTYVPDLTILKTKVCRPINQETFTETYRNKQLAFQPGTRYAYSNADYIMLGFIIEKISKVHFEDDMGYKIFTTCAMRHSGFDFDALKDETKATGYNIDGSTLSEVRPTGDTAVFYPANAMYSTVNDLYKWHEELRWYKLLPKDWQELAYVPFLNKFALGWDIEHMYNKRFMQHGGSYAGFTGAIIRQEEDDLLILVLENRAQPGYSNMPVATALLQAIYGIENHKTNADEKKEKNERQDDGDDPRSLLKKYAGKYLFNTDYILTIRLSGEELTVESPDEQPIELEQKSATIFKTKGANVAIEFVPDANGNVNKAVLHQNGHIYEGKRVKK